jgi:hypothetical protein
LIGARGLFIGHFVIAFILIALFPQVPPLVFLLGVGFPDILWPILVFLKVEKASVDPDSALQKNVKFSSYPYSHSLVTSFVISSIIGLILAFVINPIAGILFVVASSSHWFLDTVVHIHDLPILGFGRDKKIGFGLWKHGRAAFIVEYVFYVVGTVLIMPFGYVLPLLVLGTIFHLLNANSFFGFTKTNPSKSTNSYAVLALVGFIAFSLIANFMIGGVV